MEKNDTAKNKKFVLDAKGIKGKDGKPVSFHFQFDTKAEAYDRLRESLREVMNEIVDGTDYDSSGRNMDEELDVLFMVHGTDDSTHWKWSVDCKRPELGWMEAELCELPCEEDGDEAVPPKVYGKLGVSRRYIVDCLTEMNLHCGPVGVDYARAIFEDVADEVAKDVAECADCEDWSMDDLRMAFGRVLVRRLGIEVN